MQESALKNSITYSRQLIVEARHHLLKARQRELKPYHISPEQSNILDILYCIGRKATLSEIAKHTERGVNTVCQQMIRMEKDGLVRKEREVPKSTLLSFELTEKGLDAFNKSKDWKTDKVIMSTLSKEELELLMALLSKIIKKAEKYQ